MTLICSTVPMTVPPLARYLDVQPLLIVFHLSVGYINIQGMSDDNSKVAAWKFNSLDKNGDKFLTKEEISQLRRFVRKNIKPKVQVLIPGGRGTGSDSRGRGDPGSDPRGRGPGSDPRGEGEMGTVQVVILL